MAGIEQNLEQGKKWWDPHNIIVSTFIGAAAGAAMAFAVGLVVGLGLEGLAATAALMGASALIGIVVNLVTGQRWDKALLANLFFGSAARSACSAAAAVAEAATAAERSPPARRCSRRASDSSSSWSGCGASPRPPMARRRSSRSAMR